MARRKGVLKTRATVQRKTNVENINQKPNEDDRLKDDLGGNNPNEMDEPKLIPSEKIQSYKPKHTNNVHRMANSRYSSLESSNYRHRNNNEKICDGLTRSSEVTNTISSSTSLNQSKTSIQSTDDLKYLHKKFKRIASATPDDSAITLKIESTAANYKESHIRDNREDVITINNSKDTKSINSIRQPSNNYILLNGNSRATTPPLSQASNCENPVTVDEFSSSSVESQKFTLSNNYRISSQSANQKSFLPSNSEDITIANNNISQRSDCSPANLYSPVNKNLNHNNNILNRTTIVSSSSSSSSPPTTASALVVVNSSNYQKVLQQQPPHHQQQQQIQQQQQQQQQHHHQQQQPRQRSQSRDIDQNFSGRYVCPYCNLNCTKPSVLQKHIRAHTNERPYPCDTCGFAFKTKSNYYKHCRSRAHALRIKGGDPQPDDDASLCSDQDQDPELSNSSSDVISRTASPLEERINSPAIQQQSPHLLQKYSNDKPYKPKFHNAALYAKEDVLQRNQQNKQYQYFIPHNQHNNHPPQDQQENYNYPIIKQEFDQSAQLPPKQVLPGFPEVNLSHREQIMNNVTSGSSGIGSSSVTSASGGGAQLNMEKLQEHISKIISQNEAIVENKELLLQKKYPKITGGKSRSSSLVTTSETSNSKLAHALANKQQQHTQQQPHQHPYQHIQALQREDSMGSRSSSNNSPITGINPVPTSGNRYVQHTGNFNQCQTIQMPDCIVAPQPLNLTKLNEIELTRKRSSSDSFVAPLTEVPSLPSSTKSLATHPQNPERSIIKDLLLNARGLGVPNGEGEDAVYTCPLCKMQFRSAEDVKLHTSSYCQGGPSSAPISPVASPSYKYFRSNSVNVNLPEFNNPNSLAKLARSSLLELSKNPLPLAKLAWSQLKVKPSNLVLNQLNVNTNTTSSQSCSSTNHGNCSSSSTQKLIDAPLPSPGPLLGKTPLVEAYNNQDRRSEDVIITRVHEEDRSYDKNLSPKRLKFDNFLHQSFILSSSSGNMNHMTVNNSASMELSPRSNTALVKGPYMCGGDIKMLDKKDDRMRRFMSSGGCIIPISECPDAEMSPKMIRTPLLSGGSFTEVSPKTSNKDSSSSASSSSASSVPPTTPKMMIPVTPLTPSLPAPNLLSAGLPLAQHFQFPPINSITAFNPLTLPPVSMNAITPSSVLHGDKLIPFVPGIPGPNTLAPPPTMSPLPPQGIINRNASPNRKKTPSPLVHSLHETSSQHILHIPNSRIQMQRPIIRIDGETVNVMQHGNNDYTLHQRSTRSWIPPVSVPDTTKKSFNFTRMAENISPRKVAMEKIPKSPERENKNLNFENFISKTEIVVRPHVHTPHQLQQPISLQLQQPTPPPPPQSAQQPPQQQSQQPTQQLPPLHIDVTPTTGAISLHKEPSEIEIAEARSKAKSKFLRPTSLPLKPGTFTPKRHHGITPTANTLPLISPETPRPSKACIQLYLNGHAYTYLGLKCSTKMFYCTVNCPQASYIANLHKLSMYSVWQVCAENNPHPLGLKPKEVMSLYDSRQKNLTYSVAKIKSAYTTVHSQATVMTPFENNQGQFYHHQVKSIPPLDQCSKSDGSQKLNSSGSVLVGGYESNEDYTYIRGRGRGRYVCSECGIRCKKPSMLKKHIRTHTDVRPYTCKHCSFSFKTKGNLTKHMQSKTHYKKCLELGINPGPLPMDNDLSEADCDMDQQSINSGGGRTSSLPEESDSDDYSDGGDAETESSDTDESKSRLPEHEAARCLLSLSMTPPSNSVSPHMFLPRSQPQYSLQSDDIQNPIQPHSSRRVISFTSPKPPFDYQKQEQYYSNPSILPKSREDKLDESSMKPIDLTKPRRVGQCKISDIIGELNNESGLLRSLVSITDKIRTNVPSFVANIANKFDENVLLQAYLTEQALKYTKIKQSQMNKIFQPSTLSSTVSNVTGRHSEIYETYLHSDQHNGFVSRPRLDTETVTSTYSRPSIRVTASTAVTTTAVCIQNEIEDSPASEKLIATSIVDHRVDSSDSILSNQTEPSVPDSASSKVQLPASQLSQDVPKESTECTKSILQSPTKVGAKTVASEYLKMTSAEHQKVRNTKIEESDDSSSDQEMSTSETSTKPPSDFTGILARTVVVGEDGFKNNANEVQPVFPRVPISEDGRPICTICSKTFQKQHQMVLHMNIHYMERKFKCEPCAVSFRTQGHLQKHERSEAHKNKVMMTSTFGVPTTSNPRPFECSDCKVAFRIHGHLAKHLRSKTHVQKLECLQKLPFGTYAEIERAGISLTEIDTTDCDNSLASLKVLAQKLIEKDPSKLGTYTNPSCIETNSSGGISHESGSEDSPDTQAETNETCQMVSSSGTSSLSGIKRKFESFSSCSDDSLPNVTHQQPQQHELGLEKRPRTTSET